MKKDHDLYFGVCAAVRAKNGKSVPGDHYEVDKTAGYTLIILADGIGSGIKANVAACMCSSRIKELVRSGFSLRHACSRVAETMHKARSADIPFSAFVAVKILPDGQLDMIAYEMPLPLVISDRACFKPAAHHYTLGYEVIAEITYGLNIGDAVLLVSDGVTQAGMGTTSRLGWTIDGVVEKTEALLQGGEPYSAVPEKILSHVRMISGDTFGDDTSVVLIETRKAKEISVLTGLPQDKNLDFEYVRDFTSRKGKKIICGSTTAEVAAKVLGRKIEVREISDAYYKPPTYDISGVDIVTEGVITLNQVNNVLGCQMPEEGEETPAGGICRVFYEADVINFFVGTAVNTSHEEFIFRQMGLAPRPVVVELLKGKLESCGKVVKLRYY